MSGASGAGKTSLGERAASTVRSLAFHDDDGIVENSDHWIDRTLEYEARGTDVLLATPLPLGVILAWPRVPEVAGIAGCLLDCQDQIRIGRLRAKGVVVNSDPPGGTHVGMDTLAWAIFHRLHAADPQWEQQVIMDPEVDPPYVPWSGANEMDDLAWGRWSSWLKADRRWRVPVFDTSTAPIEKTTESVALWIEESRRDPPLLRADRWWTEQRGRATSS